MGIKSCTKAYWTAKNVSFYDLSVIYRKIFQKSPPVKLDVDVSIMFHSVMTDPKYAYAGRITEVASRLSTLASYGFVVTPVLDGFDRPDSKRDSWKRRTTKLICQSNATHCKLKAMSVGAMIDNGDGTQKLKDELDMYCKDAASMEKQGVIRETLPSIKEDLYDKLFQAGALDKNNMNGGYVKQPIMNVFQADPMLAFRAMNEDDYGFLYSTDSDFGLYLGPEFFYINKYKLSTKKITFDLTGVGNACMEKVKQCLNHDHSIFFTAAEHPILDTEDHVLRSLLAIILGPDVYKRGVPNYSSSNVHDFIVKNKIFDLDQNQAHEKVIDFILEKSKKKSNISKEDILTLSSVALSNEEFIRRTT